ncbi:MAG: type II toxin-antitoxin system HicB family antitoxin [Dolichospermum sp.]
MNFYTVVLRQSSGYWVGLCLENGIVGQGDTQENAVNKLKEAIESFEEVYESEDNVYKYLISIDELHEFLLVDEQEKQSEIYELRKVYA